METLEDSVWLQDCEDLVCPETKLRLHLVPLSEIQKHLAGSGSLHSRTNGNPPAIGPTEFVLLREDRLSAYPVVDGIPILLLPEQLTTKPREWVDLRDPRWAEAYEEMEHYNATCVERAKHLEQKEHNHVRRSSADFAGSFPEPAHIWIDAPHDARAEFEAYAHLAPIRGRRVAQLGGSGQHAVKLLLAGAEIAWHISPMLGECIYARALAASVGVADRLRSIASVGEQIGLRGAALDCVYSGGCFHHMQSGPAAAELHRVLAPGGRFSGVDPWKTPLHSIGTRLLGKREKGVYCKPMTPQRVEPYESLFPNLTVSHHGPLLRYLALGICRIAHVELSPMVGYRLDMFEDHTLGRIPGLSSFGGSVALMGVKF